MKSKGRFKDMDITEAGKDGIETYYNRHKKGIWTYRLRDNGDMEVHLTHDYVDGQAHILRATALDTIAKESNVYKNLVKKIKDLVNDL